jgi:GAF domain-containing protein
VISIENYERENAYGESELRLLTTIAASLGTALENARLFDETQRLLKETEQRAAELAIINSVQEGLASKLDVLAIYELVGNKIQDIFDAQVAQITIYDNAREMSHTTYYIEKGERLAPTSSKFTKGGLREHLFRTRQPIFINNNLPDRFAELGMKLSIFPGTENPKALLLVPMIVGSEVRGALGLQSIDHENVFSESDVRLLSTLANSMSVALENARLFDETQRLLKVTEDRAAELAVINSVQTGLASKLDMQAIYDLVGDKIRDIFQVEVVYIAIRNSSDIQQIDFPYYVDRGNILNAAPLTLGEGLTSKVIADRQPLLIGTMEEQIKLGAIFEADERANTYLGIPIIIGDFVAGVVSVQSYKENAFSGSDVRLLSTLASSMRSRMRVSSTRPSACSKRPNNAPRNLPSSTRCRRGWLRSWICKPSSIWSVTRSRTCSMRNRSSSVRSTMRRSCHGWITLLKMVNVSLMMNYFHSAR